MRRILVIAAACCLMAADEPQKNDAKDDKAKMQGTWKVVSMERKGKKRDNVDEMSLVVKGDTLTARQGDRMVFKGKFKLDGSKKPRTIDLEIVEGRGDKGKVSQGIYKVEGDTFTWCNAAPGVADRPKEFATNDKENHLLIVAKRAEQ